MIIDTHTHIYLNKEQSVDEIIKNLKNDWIEKIICIWIDLETSEKSIEIAKKYKNIVFPTVWIHPDDCFQYKDNFEETIHKLEKLIIENIWIVKWVWECWYDFYRKENMDLEEVKKIQEKFFIAQIKLAQKYSLPIILHSRNSKEDILKTLKEQNAKKFILHCFSEDLDFAFKAIYYSDECKISFSWIVTYKNALDIQKTAANIPLSRILIETDCPYLSPQTVRWTENFPNNTKYILEKIHELRNYNWKKESFEEVQKVIYENSREIFGI